MTADLRSRLTEALARPGRPSSDYDLNPSVSLAPGRKLRPAGVLVAVSLEGETPRVSLPKRSSALKHHPGQVAFPGGKVDEGDNGPVCAALREANEEIGLPIGAAEVLGTLPPHETVTGFHVTPVVAISSEPFEITPEPGEVAEVFCPPFTHVTDPTKYTVQGRRWRGVRRQYYTVPWGPYYIWGATARMLRALTDQVRA